MAGVEEWEGWFDWEEEGRSEGQRKEWWRKKGPSWAQAGFEERAECSSVSTTVPSECSLCSSLAP